MIARIWRATATAAGAEDYARHFTGAVLPALAGVEGHRGAYLLRREPDGRPEPVELEVVTLWESEAAIRRFAGDDATTAVVEPAARAALTSYDSVVTHHTIVADTASGGA